MKVVVQVLVVLGFSLLHPHPGFPGDASAKDQTAVAEVNGKAITARELDEPLAAQIQELERQIAALTTEKLDEASRQQQKYELEQQIFELRRKKLDELIDQKLLQGEAARRGMTVEELLAKEVVPRVPPVTDEQVDRFYEQYKNRMVQRPEAELKQKVREILKKHRLLHEQQKYSQTLRTDAKITTLLVPPVLRIQVGVAGAPLKGPESAPVTIVKFEDFDCPFCQQAQTTLGLVMARYGGKVKLVHRDFPIEQLHPSAQQAHEAARCANDQGKFWAYHDALYADERKRSRDDLKALAEQTGLDLPAFEQCLIKRTHRNDVQRDVDEGARLGIKATPVFFINGRQLTGAQPLEQFTQVIDDELARSR